MKTYSLDEVVTEWGLAGEMADPVRWLTEQIRSGRVTARKMGRSWRMTQADMDSALDVFASKRPVVSVSQGLSARSRKLRGMK